MILFAGAWIQFGKGLTSSVSVNVAKLLPCPNTVRYSIKRKPTHLRADVKTSVLKMAIGLGGGIASDGMKQSVMGFKYYDMVFHYVEFGKLKHLTGAMSVQMRSQVLRILEQDGPASSSALREIYDETLRVSLKTFGKYFESILRS